MRRVRALLAAAELATQGGAVPAYGSPPLQEAFGADLPAGWTVFLPGSLTPLPPEHTPAVFSITFEPPAPAYADLPDAATGAALAETLSRLCAHPATAAEIAWTRERFRKAPATDGPVYAGALMRLRWETTDARGGRQVAIFEILHDMAADGSCGASRPHGGEVVMTGEDLRIFRH